MTEPSVAAYQLGLCCLVGAGVGVAYGFLRPLRYRHRHLADLLFAPVLVYAWLYTGFAICKGDLRLGYTAGLFAGWLVWDCTVGKWTGPVFFGFWRTVGKIWGWIRGLFEKILKFCRKILKKCFARGKKWGTIKWYQYGETGGKVGGFSNGKAK